ncbi:MAG: amidohydrolase [Candidatus Cloacimonetes bacterium]|nr:amidohydrolase [Candidatus Cloacimonadota bacterium]
MKHLYEVRKELHKIPELAFQEFKTTEFILNYLKKFPLIKCHTFSFPGVLVEYTQGEGDYQLFRTDMDGLPLQEQTGCDFSSQHEGIMHACGHDIHMTVLIGLIEEVISQKYKKNILFLFQPAEERFGGAEKVLFSGILDKYPIKEVYALHVHPSFPKGTIASNPTVLFGIPQEFDIVFKGVSAHAANPQKGKDAIAAGCHFYQTLKQSISEVLPADERYIYHVGKISGGATGNVIADECILQGTLRALTKENMAKLKRKMIETAKMSAAQFQTEIDIKLICSYDPVVNSPRLYDKLKKCLDPGLRLEEVEPTLFGEDFGFFTTRYESLMFFIGADSPQYDLHSPFFLPAEDAIITGIMAFKSLIDCGE